MGVAVGDFDNDGWPDLFLANVTANCSEQSVPEAPGARSWFQTIPALVRADAARDRIWTPLSASGRLRWRSFDRNTTGVRRPVQTQRILWGHRGTGNAQDQNN